MAIGLIGRKCGMTRIFTEDGSAIPISVLHVENNRIIQIKTEETDGYNAIQMTTGYRKRSRLTKPIAGHYAKAGVEAGIGLWEFLITKDDKNKYSIGSELNVDVFEEGQFVDISGISIGKGFQGVIKRYNFRTQDATHGNSLSHRAPGSIGQNQTPGRVVKGKKMAGHMGSKKVTIQNLKIFSIDKDKSLLLIKGSIPGSKGSNLIVSPAEKK